MAIAGAVLGAVVVLQGPLGVEEEVIVRVVYFDKLPALAHGQPGVLDPGIVGVPFGRARIAAGEAVIRIVR